MTRIIDGKAVAQRVRQEVAADVRSFAADRGVTLARFARAGRVNVYSGSERVTSSR